MQAISNGGSAEMARVMLKSLKDREVVDKTERA